MSLLLMKRHTLAVLGVVVAATLVMVLVPWAVSAAYLRAQVLSQIAQATGVERVNGGDATIALLPSPRIKIEAIRLGNETDGAVLDAPFARGNLKLLPLLVGRLEVADLTLSDAVLRLGPHWPEGPGAAGPLMRAIELVFASPAAHGKLDRITIQRGRIEQANQKGGLTPLITGIEAQLAVSPGPGASALTSRFNWRGMDVAVQANGLDPMEFGRARQSPLRLTVESSILSAAMQGLIAGPDPQFDGTLTATTPDLVALGGWLGFDPPLTSAGTIAVEGAVRLSPASMSLSGARLVIGGQEFDGSLLGRVIEGRATVAGTLATGRLDVTPLRDALIPARSADGAWSREPFDLWRLPRADFDLRMSIASLIIGPMTLDNAAVTVLTHEGRTDVTLAGADFLKGTAKGRIGLSIGAKGAVEAKIQAHVDKAEAAPLFAQLMNTRRIMGTVNGTALLEGSGDSLSALMRSWDGKVGVTIREGELVGVNLPEALRRVERRPLIAGTDLVGGRTPFELATANVHIARGIADIPEAKVISPAARIILNGSVQLGERSLDLTGVATSANASAGKDPVTLPFIVAGSFDQPQIFLDAGSLIRRSGAAAPFLQPRPAEPGIESASDPTANLNALVPVSPH